MRFNRLALMLLAGMLFVAIGLRAQPSRIVEPINPGLSIELPLNVPYNAQAQYDQGPVAPSYSMTAILLLLKPSSQQQAALSQLLADQQNPSSPSYHRWLTAGQYADRFGLSQADIDQLTDWLRSQGFVVTYTAHGRNWIAFDGTAGQVAQAFRTEIHRYVVGGETHFANATGPSIPAALADVVAGFRGLSDFHPQPLYHQSKPVAPGPNQPRYTDPTFTNYLAPDDIATIYDLFPALNAGYDGSGLSLMVMGQTDIALSDISAFRALFNLSNTLPTTTLVPFSKDPGTTGDIGEADLDLEWTGAVARNATIIYVYSTDVFTSAQYAIDQSPILAPVMSFSYGGCEAEDLSFLDSDRTLAQQAVAEGITWVASSGDTAAAECDSDTASEATHGLAVEVPSSIPEVTAVGGTEFNEGFGSYWSFTNGPNLGSALSYIPEMAWNDTASRGTLSGGGGGVSIHYPVPSWQTGAGFPNNGFRDVPDVAFTASADHDGYMICTQGSCPNSAQGFTPIGGTSASTPVFAGILTLLNQYLVTIGAQAQVGLGNINPKLYSLAQNAAAAVYHDITVGNNIVPCQIGTPNCTTGSFGYNAGPGYDMATGLGSVDGTNLLVGWAPAPLTISGQVTLSGNALNGVTMNLSGALVRSTTTSGSGGYGFYVEAGGPFTVTPSLAGFTFIPPSTTFSNMTVNETANFTAQCGYSVSPSAPYLDSTSQAGPTLNVTAGPGCGWTSSAGGFISLTSGASGFGDGTATFTVTANSSGVDRTGTLTVAGQTITVTQRETATIFTDVSPSTFYFDGVNIMYTSGITNGCSTSPLMYCPNDDTTRGQMAVFIVRSVLGGDNFTYSPTPYFTDVPPSYQFFKWIQKLKELGITTGCTATTYCPADDVTRGEMAAFIIRARYGPTATFNYPTVPYFTDVPPSYPFFADIQKMAEVGITNGCSATLFCPGEYLTRGEMALFVVRGMLNQLLPAGAAILTTASPNTATLGQVLTVTLTGVNTHFAQGTSQVTTAPGITPSNVTVTSGTTLTVQLTVASNATAGPYSLVVTTGTEEAVLPNGFTVQ
ncbi:MAG: protease pro-enzyme activation domain-containing protein [Bryobacteraceae bacterium]